MSLLLGTMYILYRCLDPLGSGSGRLLLDNELRESKNLAIAVLGLHTMPIMTFWTSYHSNAGSYLADRSLQVEATR